MVLAGDQDEVPPSAPEDGRNYRQKLVEADCNYQQKVVTLHLVGCLYNCTLTIRQAMNV